MGEGVSLNDYAFITEWGAVITMDKWTTAKRFHAQIRFKFHTSDTRAV